MVGDNWTRSAMRDGGVVAELLLRLKEAHVTPVFLTNPAMAALRWGIRQPRSRSPRRDGDLGKNSKCSPNIPLSWIGGDSSSPSTYTDGYEATSRKINGSKLTEMGLVSGNEKLKRIKVTHQIHKQPHNQDSKTMIETSFQIPDLNMMPSQNDNLNHCFSSHVETLYGSIRIS